MRQRAVWRGMLVAAGCVLATVLAGCGGAGDGGPDDGAPSTPGGTLADDHEPLRELAPDGVVIGAAAAGGGHFGRGNDPFQVDETYREVLAAEFSSLTPENQLKWEYVHPEQGTYDFDAADELVEFAEEHGMAVRGHTLLWHSQNPAWLENGDFTDAELRAILEDHIRTVVGR